MKRLIVLTAAAILTASSSGCFHWFNRGASCNSPPPQPACGSSAAYPADPYMGAPGAAVPPGVYPGPGGMQ